MERAVQATNEEYYLGQIADLIRQHKEILEEYLANSQENLLQSRLNGQISYYDYVLKLIYGHLKTLDQRRRRQRIAALFQHGLIQSIVFVIKPKHFKELFMLLLILLCLSTAVTHFYRTVGQTKQEQIESDSLHTQLQEQTQSDSQSMQATGFVDPNPLQLLTKGKNNTMATSQTASASYGERVVGNTGGMGVRYRLEPFDHAASHIALEEGRQVSLLSKHFDAAGELWWKVRLPEGGEEGYIRDTYLLK